jgi:hypothetical protein
MIFIPITTKELTFKIKLNKSDEKSFSGLVSLQCDGFKEASWFDVTCNQIDSTVENLKRILKVIH